MEDALEGILVIGTFRFVEENIVRSILGCDVTKTLGVIKPLHTAFEPAFDALA